jgi:hypothetical protein
MSQQSFTNEYQRVLARPDVSELRAALISAQKFVNRQTDDAEDDPDDLGFDLVYTPEDPELLLSLAVLAMAEFDDPQLIGFIAAGPLEDIFMFSAQGRAGNAAADPDLIESLLVRIENEARKCARFRWMLSGVWTTSFKPDHARRIKLALCGADMNVDPLPQRPWA